MNETELLKAFRIDRSEEAFAELVRRYAGLVYSAAKRRLANAALAEDVTQIVFIRFAKTPPNVKTPGELAAWLHRTTLNVAIDTWRSETRRRNREQQAVIMESNSQSGWEEISPKLDQAVNQLDDEDRQAILLRFFGQKTMRDVGATLGVSEAAAKMRVSRAVERLRTQLGVGGAACTATVLGALLLEHSAEAAPIQLVSRLAAMRLPKLATTGAIGGLAGALWRISKLKLAAGVIVVVSIGLVVAHFLGSSKDSVPVVTSQAPSDMTVEGTAKPRTANQIISSDNEPPVVPAARPPKILFHVLDAETGRGLPQTQIHFAYFGPGGQGEGHEIVTDENGDAPLQAPDDPTKDSAPNVFVTAEGHVPKVVTPKTNDYTMRLDPAMTASGLIVDERGIPVAGVTIFIQGAGNKPGQAENVDFQTCPVTNHEDGSWTSSYIPKDFTNEIRFILKKPGYAVTFPIVPVPKVNLNALLLVIDSGAIVTGKITDRHDHPIANARIKVLAGDRNKWQSTHSDEDGVFAFTGVIGETEFSQAPPLETNASGGVMIRGLMGGGMAHVDLAVQADGFASEMKTIQLLNATNIVNFALAIGNIFRGHVVDDMGNPIPNAVVQTDYSFSGGSQRKFDWTTHTDSNGVFRWDSAPAGETAYWFEAEGYKIIRDMPLIADGTDHEIRLQRNLKK
jgi:RNA polymerase sigma factor (sigma-70 family)